MDHNGHNFERSAIEQWMLQTSMCPFGCGHLSPTALYPNRALKEEIEERVLLDKLVAQGNVGSDFVNQLRNLLDTRGLGDLRVVLESVSDVDEAHKLCQAAPEAHDCLLALSSLEKSQRALVVRHIGNFTMERFRAAKIMTTHFLRHAGWHNGIGVTSNIQRLHEMCMDERVSEHRLNMASRFLIGIQEHVVSPGNVATCLQMAHELCHMRLPTATVDNVLSVIHTVKGVCAGLSDVPQVMRQVMEYLRNPAASRAICSTMDMVRQAKVCMCSTRVG